MSDDLSPDHAAPESAVPCVICGEAMPRAGGPPDASLVCPGCAPNLAASLDRRLLHDALYVPDAVIEAWHLERTRLTEG